MPAKMHPLRLSHSNALCLTLFDVLAFDLGYITEDLQNEIGNKKTGQVFFIPSPGIKQRKIENDNIAPLFPCQYTPLILYFIIINVC